MLARLWVWCIGLSLVLAACGDDGEGGNEDTLLSGFSLIVIIVIGFFIVRYFMNKNRG